MPTDEHQTEPIESISDRVQISVLLLADRAEVSQGKLYIMGGSFDTCVAASLPAPVQFGVALVIRVPWNETNEKHDLALQIVTADGQSIAEMKMAFNTGRPSFLGKGDEQRVPFAIPQISLALPSFGTYVVRTTVNGQPGPMVPFHVRQVVGGLGGVPQQSV
jgi:hypothetical protein